MFPSCRMTRGVLLLEFLCFENRFYSECMLWTTLYYFGPVHANSRPSSRQLSAEFTPTFGSVHTKLRHQLTPSFGPVHANSRPSSRQLSAQFTPTFGSVHTKLRHQLTPSFGPVHACIECIRYMFFSFSYRFSYLRARGGSGFCVLCHLRIPTFR
jgi:hypothetical protein